jgi:hypothetical protein
LGEAHLRGINVSFRCGLRFLLEGMKNEDRIGQASCVDHPESACVVPYPDFFDTFANRGHGLEIIGLLAALYLVKLATRILPCVALVS